MKAVWELHPLNTQTVFQTIFTKFNWANGFLWSFNTLLNSNELDV